MLNRGVGRGFGWLPVVAVLALAASLACGQASASPGAQDSAVPTAPSGSLKVVSTVSPITSLVENVGGTRITLEGVVPEGVSSHTFEPAPSVASTLTTADLFVANGLFLEEPVIAMARAS